MLPYELTKDTPYLALSGELWSVFYEYFNRNWPCYKGFLLLLADVAKQSRFLAPQPKQVRVINFLCCFLNAFVPIDWLTIILYKKPKALSQYFFIPILNDVIIAFFWAWNSTLHSNQIICSKKEKLILMKRPETNLNESFGGWGQNISGQISQHNCCWCIGSLCRQGISSHGTDHIKHTWSYISLTFVLKAQWIRHKTLYRPGESWDDTLSYHCVLNLCVYLYIGFNVSIKSLFTIW